MADLVLLRLTRDSSIPTSGVLLFNGEPFCVTLELPWVNNERNVSCIPEGTYPLFKRRDAVTHVGQKEKITYELLNVPGRSGILFHAGNSVKDTQGCILLGCNFNKSQRTIEKSRAAVDMFLTAMSIANGPKEVTIKRFWT